MYENLLLVHSWMRWIVLISMILLTGRCYRAWLAKKAWTDSDKSFVWAFDQAFNYQVLFGLILWLALSPYTKAVYKAPALALENPLMTFWTLRHPLTMLAAIAIFNIFKDRAKKAPAEAKHRLFALGLTGSLLLILSAIPWTFFSYGRPLFRWLN